MESRDVSDQAITERSALIVATLTSFMGPFMVSSVNVALPAIGTDLHMNAIQLSWIATSYLLAMAVVLVPAGKLADIYGRKKLFAIGLFIFSLGTFAAIFANSYLTLITARLIQGLGGALFVSTGMAILTSIFPPNKRGRVIGIYVAAVYIGLSVGPFAGGLLAQNFGWRAIFIVVVPMGIASLFLTLHRLEGEWFGEQGQKFDVFGAVLYAIAILSVVYGATQIPSFFGISLFLAGCVLFYIFVRHQLSVRFPVFDVHLFTTNKPFAFSSLAALLNYSATFAVTFLLSLYLQYLKGMTPQVAGMILMVQPITMAILSPIAGHLSDRIEPRLLATAGMMVTFTGVLILTTLTPQTDMYLIIGDLLFLGIGFSLFSSPNMSAIMGAVEKRHYGLASGAVATMRLLGQMFSMAMTTIVLSLIIGRQPITPGVYELFLKSIHTVYTISALLCLIGVYFSWFRGSTGEHLFEE